MGAALRPAPREGLGRGEPSPGPLTWPWLPLSRRKLPSVRCRSGTGGQSFCFTLLGAGKGTSKAKPSPGVP